MSIRLSPCARGKQIIGSKNWFGFPGFGFPGWKGTYSYGTSSWDGTPNFAAGDLVLTKLDSYTTLGTTYPAVYFPYKCTSSVTGAGDPGSDGAHFTPWDYSNGDGATRQAWPDTSRKFLEFTIVTKISDFPFGTDFAVTSDLTTRFTPTGADSFVDTTAGTFTEDWTYGSHLAGAATHTGPGSPTTDQSAFVYPNVPPHIVNIASGDPTPIFIGTRGTAPLQSWNFTATELQFVFATWWAEVVEEQWAPPLCTVTQTLTVTTEYLLTDAQGEAAALLTATTFDALAWNQRATCSYNADGTISVAVTNITGTSPAGTTCSGGSMAGPNATAATATAFNLNGGLSLGKAQVDVCGPYHVNTFNCPTITVGDCTSVDGFSPVTINPPAAGTSVLFPGC